MSTVQLSVSEAQMWIFGAQPMVHVNHYVPALVPMVLTPFYSWKEYFLRELNLQIATPGEA